MMRRNAISFPALARATSAPSERPASPSAATAPVLMPKLHVLPLDRPRREKVPGKVARADFLPLRDASVPLYPGERSVERKRRPGAARHGIVTHPSGRLMCNKGRKGPTMLIRNSRGIPSSEITPKHVYLTRRTLLAGVAGLLGAGTVTGDAAAEPLSASPSPFSTDEKRTSLKDVTSYNNFYEFGVGKDDPARNAGALTAKPWTVKIDGLVSKPGDYPLEDLLKPVSLEERVYRMRCVEGWSMVIPWVGFPLAEVLKRADPQGSAKYVAFETLVRPKEMPGQRALLPVLGWPYVEGLRLDEALHPLTIMAVGLYGETLAQPERRSVAVGRPVEI